jgi:UPF0716 protein FxsA
MAPAVGRRRNWLWTVMAVLLLVVPLLEVLVIIAVGQAIGGWPTFFLLLAESALGAWLVRHQGARVWQSLQTALTTGRMPSRQLADAALVLVGGVLLLTPGFLTDLVGFFLVLPFTRPAARRALEAVVARRLLGGVYAPGAMSTPSASPRTGPGTPREGSDDVIEGELL